MTHVGTHLVASLVTGGRPRPHPILRRRPPRAHAPAAVEISSDNDSQQEIPT